MVSNKNKRRVWVVGQFVFTLIVPILIYIFQESFKIDGFGIQLVIILIFIGCLVTISTHVLLEHITTENNSQNDFHIKRLEILSLLNYWIKCIENSDEEIQTIANKKFVQFRDYIHGLEEGHWEISDSIEIDNKVKDYIEKSKKYIYSTHKVLENWEDSTNKKIFAEMKKVTKRKLNKVTIEMIFILSDKEVENFDNLYKILSEHKTAYSNVFCVEEKEIHERNKEYNIDMVLVDGDRVLIEDISTGDKYYNKAIIHSTSEKIDKYETIFLRIKDMASDLDTFRKRIAGQ